MSQQVTELQTLARCRTGTTKVELEQKKAALETELSLLRTDLHAKEVTLAAKEGELNALATEGRDLESKVHTVVFELQSIEQQDTEENASDARSRSCGLRRAGGAPGRIAAADDCRTAEG